MYPVFANQISQAVSIVRHGGVIAYSTDTVLGLGCDPGHRGAVERILWLKQRSMDKGLIVLVADVHALKQYSQSLTASQYESISSATPTPRTWLVPAKRSLPVWLTGTHARMALRISRHPLANQLCVSNGAIVSTSANFSGYPSALDHPALRKWFGPHLDYVIIGPKGTGAPSEIHDLISGKILRQSQ